MEPSVSSDLSEIADYLIFLWFVVGLADCDVNFFEINFQI